MVQAALTTYHRLGDLNNRNLLLTVLQAGKSKIKVLVDLVPGESPFPCLQMAFFSLHPDKLKGEISFVMSLLTEALISSQRLPPYEISTHNTVVSGEHECFPPKMKNDSRMCNPVISVHYCIG